MRHHELARAVTGPLGCGPTVAALGPALRHEGVEVRIARLEIRARVIDDAGERGDGRDVRRAEVDRRVRRAHSTPVVAVRGREADLLAGQHAAGASEAGTAPRAADDR